jgi:hypothetical protein
VLAQAIRADGDAFRAMHEGDGERARARLRDAVALYRESWALAPPRSYGRLVAWLKSAVLAGDGAEAAAAVRPFLAGGCDSPTSCYALALVAVIQGDDGAAAAAAEGMREGGEAFARAADALAAIAAGDPEAYRAAVEAIVADFAGREDHLTGVPIADTALLMEALAEPRGLAVHPESPLMPARVV